MAVSRNVTVIPAIKRVGNNKTSESKPKIRVAAYCRVSTDSEEQASSYEIQIEHYTNYIKKNKEWELAGIFADDGITGTNTKKREEFNRMIEECMAGKIDMIITKSISRFARNTLDCLKYIRQLKDKNIAVFFEKENINTMDSKGEIMLTIMASLAQQESQSLSQNVKLGIQYRYQQGEVQVNHKRFLGYTKDENKQLVIDPEGAEVVKRIYREYLEGASLLQISRGLEADGILTAAGKAKWRPETLKKILQNEKYIGDALLQKTYTVDFLSKKRVKNNGIVPQYYVENSHEPIIPRELFMQVQEEMVRRANLRGRKGGKKRVYSSKYDVDAAKVGAGEIQSHVILGLNPGLINASGYSWTGDYVTVTGDLCADLLSNIASEQRAKVVYEYLYRQIDDKKVRQTIDFLLNREEAHNQMFRDAFNAVQNSGSNQDFGTTKAAKMYFSI